MSDWQLLSPNGAPQPGAPVYGGGGNDLSGYRDILDARRSVATARTPNAEYPDGYLGTINTRREDRLLSAVQSRLTQRNYQRGVHKGEKIDPGDYMWPDEFNPTSALQAQAAGGTRWGPVGSLPVEQINHMGKNHMIPPEQMSRVAGQFNVREVPMATGLRQQKLAKMLPSWR